MDGVAFHTATPIVGFLVVSAIAFEVQVSTHLCMGPPIFGSLRAAKTPRLALRELVF